MTAELLATIAAQAATIAALNKEVAALRIAMDAIRTLTNLSAAPAAPVVPEQRPAPAEEPPVTDEARGERLLERLRTEELWPRAARMRYQGKYREPRWRPDAQPEVAEMVRYGAFSWSREYDGPVTVLDKSGAHLAAVSSVEVGWDQLVQRGRIPFAGAPGYYYVPWFPWPGDGPHPLGAAAEEARVRGGVWVPHTRAKLIDDLVQQGRYPEVGDLDAWTSEHKARMDGWSGYINSLRRRAIEQHGRESEEYAQVKAAFSSAITAMIGSRQPGQPRVWKTRQLRRPDWAHAIQDLAACTMWRACDAARQLAIAAGEAHLAPVSVRNEDELWIPARAEILFTVDVPKGRKTPLFRLDETGMTLGTWKVKS